MKILKLAGKNALDLLNEKLNAEIVKKADKTELHSHENKAILDQITQSILNGGSSGENVYQDLITLSYENFVQNTDEYAAYYPYYCDSMINGITESCFVEVVYTPASIALGCMAPHVRSMNGSVRFYAYEVPSANVGIEIMFWKEVDANDSGN